MALINLRNALMAGKRLPYDAEVEYLESTGTQWITISITLESTDTIGATFTPRASSSNGAIYCSSFGNRGNLLRRDTSGNLSVFSNGGSNAVSSYVAGTEYTVVWGNRQVSVNGTPTTVPYNVYLIVSPGTSISLFATSTGTLSGYCAISHFYVEGKLDLIPVRKGTVGYLYDRVTGKLFGNAGTGDFVLGPDVVPATWVDGEYWTTLGVATVLSGASRCENFIPVYPSSSITFYLGVRPGGTTLYMVQYNANKERVNSTYNANGSARTVTIPANCYYIRVSAETANKNEAYIHDNTNDRDLLRNGMVVPDTI